MAEEDISPDDMPLNLFWHNHFMTSIPDADGAQNIPLLTNIPTFETALRNSQLQQIQQPDVKLLQHSGPITRSGGSSSQSQDVHSNGRSSKVVDRKRRMHAKSRAGCVACKERRLKCDENKPSCNRCVRRKTQCEYIFVPLARKDRTSSYSASGSVTKIILSPSQIDALVNRDGPSGSNPQYTAAQEKVEIKIRMPRELNLQDLRLMHHFTTQTTGTLTDHSDVDWKNGIPTLAFTSPSVMHSILTVASSHFRHLNPEDKALEAAGLEHRQHALRLLRESVSKKIDASNVDVVIATMSLLIIQTWTAFDPAYEDFMNDGWITFVSGCRHIVPKVWSLLPESQFGSLLQTNWDFVSFSVSGITEKLRKMIDHPPEITASYDRAMYVDCHMLLATMIEETRMRPQHKDLPRLISGYLQYSPEPLIAAALNYEKVALVLFAHWCAGILLIEDRDWWWSRGRATFMIRRIDVYVGPLWREYMVWPLAAIGGNDELSNCIENFEKVRLNSVSKEL